MSEEKYRQEFDEIKEDHHFYSQRDHEETALSYYIAGRKNSEAEVEFLKNCNENQKAYFDECEKLREEITQKDAEIEELRNVLQTLGAFEVEVLKKELAQLKAELKRERDFVDFVEQDAREYKYEALEELARETQAKRKCKV